MDPDRLDHLARSFATAGSRRHLIGLLGGLPLAGGVFGSLDLEQAEGKERRRRRKQRHKQRKDPGKRKGKRTKPCKAESVADTCAGKCGSVTNTCKKQVDCGSCDCTPACAECFTCQGAAGGPGTCVPQDAGTPCGAATTCELGTLQPQSSCDGRGECEGVAPVSCAPYTQCAGDACAATCSDDDECVAGSFCNSSGQCAGDLLDGETCTHGGQCASDFCVDSVCCNGACDGACQACNLGGSVGTCTTEANGTTCDGDKVCCGGTCQECCDHADCSGSEPVCVSGQCAACSASPADCPGSTCCNPNNGTCVASCPAGDPICGPGNVCGACTSHAQCGGDALCVEGACRACDVVDGQNLATAVGAAQDGETLYVCAGTYTGGITISTNIALIGAGDGMSGTIIQGGNDVLVIRAGTVSQPVTLRGLRIQNGKRGISINPLQNLTMIDCTVSGNTSESIGAGIDNYRSTLLMTGCTVENNTAQGSNGGGLHNELGSATLTDCLFQGNVAVKGGAIFNQNQGGTVTLDGTRVTGNWAVGSGSGGSGIYNDGSTGSTVTLQGGSTVCANNPTEDQCHDVTGSADGCQVTCPAP